MMRLGAKRRGGIMVIVAAGMVVMIGAAAWVADAGSMLQSRTHQQAAADAGALAAARALLPSDADEAIARAQAIEWTGRNGYAITGDDVTFWTHSSGRRAVTVSWTETTPSYFARFFGDTSHPVYVTSSAILGELEDLPGGVVPFAVPSYQDAAGDWWVLSSTAAGDYRRMIDDPPTEMILKVDAQGNHAGNFLGLGIDGPGGSIYRESIVYGADTQLSVGDVIPTQTGNMIGPTKQAIADRLARGPEYADIVVPLIAKSEWDAATGHSHVTIIGFVSAHITRVTGTGEIYATFTSLTYPGDPTLGNGAGAGGFAPMLIDGSR